MEGVSSSLCLKRRLYSEGSYQREGQARRNGIEARGTKRVADPGVDLTGALHYNFGGCGCGGRG